MTDAALRMQCLELAIKNCRGIGEADAFYAFVTGVEPAQSRPKATSGSVRLTAAEVARFDAEPNASIRALRVALLRMERADGADEFGETRESLKAQIVDLKERLDAAEARYAAQAKQRGDIAAAINLLAAASSGTEVSVPVIGHREDGLAIIRTSCGCTMAVERSA